MHKPLASRSRRQRRRRQLEGYRERVPLPSILYEPAATCVSYLIIKCSGGSSLKKLGGQPLATACVCASSSEYIKVLLNFLASSGIHMADSGIFQSESNWGSGDFVNRSWSKMLNYGLNFNVNGGIMSHFQDGAVHMPPRKWGGGLPKLGACATAPASALFNCVVNYRRRRLRNDLYIVSSGALNSTHSLLIHATYYAHMVLSGPNMKH